MEIYILFIGLLGIIILQESGADPEGGGGSGGPGDHFFKLHFRGKEEFLASRSVPTLMVLNKDRKYVISLFFQLFLWFISGQTKVDWRLFII
jgi:preprotein translocase subunit SecG